MQLQLKFKKKNTSKVAYLTNLPYKENKKKVKKLKLKIQESI